MTWLRSDASALMAGATLVARNLATSPTRRAFLSRRGARGAAGRTRALQPMMTLSSGGEWQSEASRATTTYQPHLFQPAHPDDRGGGGGALGGGTSAANECTGASPAGVETPVSTEGEGTAKCPRSKDTVNSRCANCDTGGPVRKCSQCRVKHYCGRVCQRVSRAYSARKSRARACSRMTDDGLAAPLPPPGALHVRWAQEGLPGDGAR